MKLDKEFIRLQKHIEKMANHTQLSVAKNHKKILDDLRFRLSKIYEQYEIEGQVTFENMAKYNRLQKLDKEVSDMVAKLYRDNSKLIKGHLTAITKDTYSNTVSIVENVTERKLKGIVKKMDVPKTVNSEMAGLKWTERIGKHRNDVIYNIQKELRQGFSQGDTYKTMVSRLKKELEISTSKANTIVRTEGHRVHAQAKVDSLDSIARHGVKMQKTWLTAQDERVRGQKPSDTMDHIAMNGITIPYEDEFELPDGSRGMAPGLTGSYNDINCRCIMTIDFIEDNKIIK